MYLYINKVRTFCVFATALTVFGSTTFNYLVSYGIYDDIDMEWRIYSISVALCMFFMGVYIWISEHQRQSKKGILVSGWLLIYLFFVLLGVLVGYNLPSAELIIPLFLIIFLGFSHFAYKLWRNLF